MLFLTTRLPISFALGLLLGLSIAVETSAQTPALPVTATDAKVTSDELQARIKELEAKKDFDETVKGRTIELYRQSLRLLESLRSNESAGKSFEQARKTAPAETTELRTKLARLEDKTVTLDKLKVSQKMTLDDLEQRLVKEKADLTALETKLAELEKVLEEEKTRPNAVRTRLTELKQSQEDIDTELKTPAPPGEAAELTKARQLSLELRRQAQRAEIYMLDQELLSQGARNDLFKAKRDVTFQSITHVRQGVQLLEEVVNQRRLVEAEQAQAAAAEAEREAAGKHPAIRA